MIRLNLARCEASVATCLLQIAGYPELRSLLFIRRSSLKFRKLHGSQCSNEYKVGQSIDKNKCSIINIIKPKLQRRLLTNVTAPFPLETKLVEQSIPVQRKFAIALETRFLHVNRNIMFRNRD